MLGISFDKLVIIGVIAVFLLGPDRLPAYAAKLAELVKKFRDFSNTAKDRVKDEMGSDFNDVDWAKLDPRQYDPRRIVRDALFDDESEVAHVPTNPRERRPALVEPLADGARAPFDDEAT